MISILKKIYHKINKASIAKQFRAFGNASNISNNIKIQNGKYISIGSNTNIGENSILMCWDMYQKVKLYPSLKIGNNVSITRSITIYCTNNIVIENNVLIASNVLITDENHGMDPRHENYLDTPLVSKPVYIAKGVWIGEQVCILPGVTIGEKSIIGANSTVIGAIPSYSIAVGNPAKVIKRWDFNRNEWVKV